MTCGASLERAEAREERRIVTILFADLAGFTARSERLDPEDVRAFLLPYYDVLTSEVARHGGLVDRFLGDGIMAIFGAPVAHEDDPERAVRAALRIVERVPALELDLHARIGVNTGPVLFAAGSGGERDDSVTGDAVNTAARLQALAPVDGIVVGEPTYQTTRHLFHYEALEPAAAKGKAEPLVRWRPLAPIARREEAQVEVSPFVGRELDLAELVRLFERSRTSPSTELVTIVAEPGIGKSRLVREFRRHLDAVPDLVRWRLGRCLPYGDEISLRPLGEMVKAHAGMLDTDDQAILSAKLDAVLSEPDTTLRAWMRDRVGPLVGLAVEAAPPEQEEAFTAWRRFLEGIAHSGPTVLVVEDLHWADPALVAFLEHFLDHSAGLQILVLATARPEVEERHPTWLARAHHATVVSLTGLPDQAMAALLESSLPGTSPELRDTVVARAGGSPLYAEQLAAMLRDHLTPAGGYSFDEAAIPATIQALLDARMDALPADARAVLLDASVVGRTFWSQAVAALGDREVEDAEALLAELARRNLVRRVLPSTMAGASEFRFVHALVRDVAYAKLPRTARARRHAAAGGWLETAAPDRVQDLARHYAEALDLARAAREHSLAARLEAPTLRCLMLAGDRSMGLDTAAALDAFNRARSLAPRGHARRAEVLTRFGAAARDAGRYSEAAEALEEAVTGYRALGDARGIARASTSLGSIEVERYDASATRTLSDTVAELGVDTAGEDAALADDPAAVELLAQLARAYLVNGHLAEAVACAERALRRAERLHLDQLTADALAVKGSALLEDCRVAEGIELLRASLAVSEEHGRIGSAVLARSSLTLGLMVDDPGEALRVAGEGLETASRVGLRDVAVRVASNWADAALETGAWDRVEEVLPAMDRADMPITDRVDLASIVQLVRVIRGVGGAMEQLEALAALVPPTGQELADLSLRTRRSLALLVAGRTGAALAEAEAARTLALPVSRRAAILEGTIPGARAALWAGDLGRLQGALAELEASGLRGRWIDGTIVTLRAGLAARRGDVEAAIAGYGRAAQAWRGLEVSFQASLGSLEAARLLPADHPEAVAAAATARRILTGLGATLLLDRLDAGLDVGP